jgi:hypothetical protein
MGGIYECAVEMGSGAMTHIPSYRDIVSGIQKLMGAGEFTDTQQHGGHISLHLFFQNKEIRLNSSCHFLIHNVIKNIFSAA